MQKNTPGKKYRFVSAKELLVANRFRIKSSYVQYSDKVEVVMLVIIDMLENNFSVKYFTNADEASQFVKLLSTLNN